MIDLNIKSYVKHYENFIDKKLCLTILNELKKEKWNGHRWSNYEKLDNIRNNDGSVCVYYSSAQHELQNRLWFAVEKYIIKDFKSFEKWWDGWNGYTTIRFNKYDKQTEMDIHCDHIHSMFDGQIKGIPTLSIVGCLNDNYDGGDFIMWEKEKINLKQGSVLIFPSNFMFPHRVNPIKKGTRYSFVSWVY